METEDFIKKAIRGCNLSYSQIGRQSDLSVALVSRFMAGKRGLSVKSMDRLAPVIGVKVRLEIIAKRKRGKK